MSHEETGAQPCVTAEIVLLGLGAEEDGVGSGAIRVGSLARLLAVKTNARERSWRKVSEKELASHWDVEFEVEKRC